MRAHNWLLFPMRNDYSRIGRQSRERGKTKIQEKTRTIGEARK